jgi:hypothetical protein
MEGIVSWHAPARRRLSVGFLAVVIGAAGVVASGASQLAVADVAVIPSTVTGTDGRAYSVTNHLVRSITQRSAEFTGRREWLIVWAGDENIADTVVRDTGDLLGNPTVKFPGLADPLPGPDFLAVIDATKGSPTYGNVVNTVTVPLVENEPHHMQYIWHKGQRIYAGGLFTDITFVFDVAALPQVALTGVNLPTDTLCGSVPDAYWVLNDGTAYGTYMGGPDVAGPCVYSDLSIRTGNGFGGSPGEIVHIGPNGRTLSEMPAALPLLQSEDPVHCVNIPALSLPTCANPHGIQVREDLNRLVASDFAEPRNIILDPVKPPTPFIARNTVRIFDIANRNRPRLVSVSTLPDGPRVEVNPGHEEPIAQMETTVTNLPQHKGAFTEAMCGGVIYYTPDITNPNPVWREVFDDTFAAEVGNPAIPNDGGCDGGGWVQTSLDDKYLYHAVIGRSPGAQNANDPGSTKMVYVLDIQRLLAAGNATRCSIDNLTEVHHGGSEPDCPALVSVLPFQDTSSGGPHWGTLDNFQLGQDGFYHETTNVTRISVSDYFVARAGIDGNHRVYMVDVDPTGHLSFDPTFVDQNDGTPGVNFNRTGWPHGNFSNAKPHSQLFVVADADLR